MGWIQAVAAAIGAVAGGIAGGSDEVKSKRLEVDPEQAREENAFRIQNEALAALESQFRSSSGVEFESKANLATLDLAKALKEHQKTGGAPSLDDIRRGRGVAKSLFAAEQTSLDQAFEDQSIQAARLSASLGRSADDPILQAKLRTGFMRQQALLNSRQGVAASKLALALPSERLRIAGQRANLLTNASNRVANIRSSLLGLGSQVGNSDRNFRLQTGTVFATDHGSFAKAFSGAIGGAAQGLSLGSGLGGGGGSTNNTGRFAPDPSLSGIQNIQGTNPNSFNQFSLGGGFQPAPNYAAPNMFSGQGYGGYIPR